MQNPHYKKNMTEEKLSQLTDQELLEEAKKLKSASIINALLIGFMVGVIIYSIVKSNFGFLMLIPLLIIYQMVKSSKKNEALKKVLKDRDLKSWNQ